MRSHFLRIFRWHIFRYLVRHRLLALLNIFSVALGVAVYLATQIANRSANNAFAATIDVVAGKADLEITAPAGNLPETLLATVTRESGIAAATPLLRRVISLPDWPGEYLDLLGIDIFTNGPFRTFDLKNSDRNGFDVESWLRGPNTIAISAEFAKQHNLRGGQVIHTQLNGVDRQLCVGFVMPISRMATDPHFAAMDIGWAQELLSRRGTLGSIQVRLQNPREREIMTAHLRKIVPADVVVATPARRGDQVVKLLGSFELNLTAMSLVSLLVGMFLIYNTVSASVVRRRGEIGILRSLGVTRREVHGLFLGEALLLGAVGSCVGLIGGVVLGRGLIGTVADTISSLYVLVNVKAMAIEPSMFGVAFAIGLGSVLIAAWLPARAAANIDPVRALNSGTIIEEGVNLSSAWLWCALVSIAIAIMLSFFALASGPAWLGFGAAFFVLLGFALIVPAATTCFSRAVSHVLRILRNRIGSGLLEITLAAANLPRA
ncbi:MAG: ABC transporter permease, partial [Chthoniobacterales bacterium]